MTDTDKLCGGGLAVLENGRPICPYQITRQGTDRDTMDVKVARLLPDGRFESDEGEVGDRLTMVIGQQMPMLLAAVDPAAEDRLVGLNRALDEGRYLRAGDGMEVRDGFVQQLPVLAANRLYSDNTVTVKLSHGEPDGPMTGLPPDRLVTALDGMPTTAVRQAAGDTAKDYRETVTRLLRENLGWNVNRLVQPGATRYDRRPAGSLAARSVPATPEIHQMPDRPGIVPWQVDDTAFRPLSRVPPPNGFMGVANVVGSFDPERIAGFDPLSEVPLETYEPPGATGADQATRDLLGDRPLRPDGNPAGYLAAPPLLLTTTEALTGWLKLTGSPRGADPYSAVRVRVAGARDFSGRTREQVRQVADAIAARTGLDVDITYGSSPAPQTVEIAAGAYGRPALLLTEGWSRMGVATAVMTAVNGKSAVLFLLVLVVCVLFLLNAVTAAVRNRRAELAVLVALGWPARRIATAVLSEILLLGLAAGLLSVLLSWPLGTALDIDVSLRQALPAVPVAVGLALLAGIVPALRAARIRPVESLRPAVVAPRRARPARGVTTMGLANLTRNPGRTALGAGALAIGVASLTVLLAATWTFRGAITGNVLGDEISVQVRGVDVIAVVTIALLGVLAVADVLYLNISERAAELATLRVTGWPAPTLARLVATEGFGIGLIGALAGAGTGLGAVAWLTGSIPPALPGAAALAAAAGTLVATAAALVPALLQNRTPVARALAEE